VCNINYVTLMDLFQYPELLDFEGTGKPGNRIL